MQLQTKLDFVQISNVQNSMSKRSGGGLKTFTTKSQRRQGNKKAASRKIFHLQIFVPLCLSGKCFRPP